MSKHWRMTQCLAEGPTAPTTRLPWPGAAQRQGAADDVLRSTSRRASYSSTAAAAATFSDSVSARMGIAARTTGSDASQGEGPCASLANTSTLGRRQSTWYMVI